MKMPDADALLALTDDFELCDGVFCRLADFDNQIDVDSYSEEERVVTLVWHASGIIANGGFEYLFEGWFSGDPGYVYTAAAFKAIGATQSYEAFQRALRAFGGPHPDSFAEREAIFNQMPTEERRAINIQFIKDAEHVRGALAGYIREHRSRFKELLS